MKLLHVGHQRIVLARTDKGFVAFEDHCTHRGGSLADGVLICDTVQCPWHGSQFDVRTGAARSGPAGEGIHVYRVEERGDEVCLLL
jgi:nitrite reductase/ring-hydroxylating ferredoxin subunit